MKRQILFAVCLCLWGSMIKLYAQSAHLEWARRIGNNRSDQGFSIAVDPAGNVYTTGKFAGIVDFDPFGSGQNFSTTPSPVSDVFVSRLNASGYFSWARQIGGSGGDDATAMTMDGAGNIYITGVFSGTVDFNPGAGIAELESVGGTQDVFVCKLDTAGNYIWANRLGSRTGDRSYGIAVDGAGSVYVTGIFNDTLHFDPATGIPDVIAAGYQDVFVCKLNAAGSFVWAKGIGGGNYDYGYGVAADDAGYLYVSGYFNDSADFDPGPGISRLVSAGSQDVYVSKLDTAGNFVWAKQIGGKGTEYCTAITLDAAGSLYLAGHFNDTADFDPGPGISRLVPAGGLDAFACKLDTAGSLVWARKWGGKAADYCTSIRTDTFGNVYTTGYFNDTADFDPGAGVAELVSAGNTDIFVSRLNAYGNFIWAGKMGGTGADRGLALTLDEAGNIYTTGYFNGTADFNPGPAPGNLVSGGGDDIFIHKMRQDACVPTASSLRDTACDMYTLNARTYTVSGTYIQTFINAGGCDSALVLELVINQPTGDTLVYTACDSFALNGLTYTAGGSYIQNFTNSAGCDSFLTLELIINNTVPASVTQSGAVLTAGTGGAYQWFDCDSGRIIPGATAQHYTAVRDGNYAVIMASHGCSDTSDCRTVTVTGIRDTEAAAGVTVFPNPARDRITVILPRALDNASIKLLQVTGQTMAEYRNVSGASFSLEIMPYPPGIYLMEIQEAGHVFRVKIAKD